MSCHKKCTIPILLMALLPLLLSLAPVQFPLIISLHYCFNCQSLIFLSTTSLSGSLNFHSNIFSHPMIILSCPCHRHLFLCTTFIMSSIPNCCLSSTSDSLSLNFTPFINLIILISVQCNSSSLLFSLTTSHFSVTYNSEHMRH